MGKSRKSNGAKHHGEPTPPTPPGKKSRGPVLFIQLTDEENGYLLDFIQAQTVEPDRSAVGKKALKKFLRELGYWPPDK